MDSCINTPMKYQIDIISVFVMSGSLIWYIYNSTEGFPDPSLQAQGRLSLWMWMCVRGITQETWKVVLMGPKAESGKARSEPGNS